MDGMKQKEREEKDQRNEDLDSDDLTVLTGARSEANGCAVFSHFVDVCFASVYMGNRDDVLQRLDRQQLRSLLVTGLWLIQRGELLCLTEDRSVTRRDEGGVKQMFVFLF